jgi:hypothetical protein
MNDPDETENRLVRIDAPKGGDLLSDGKFALGVLSGIILLAFLYIALSFVGFSFTRSEAIQLLPASIALPVAFASVQRDIRRISEHLVGLGTSSHPVHVMNRNVQEGMAENKTQEKDS